MGFEEIFRDVILPAAGQVIPSVLGNRAQAAGIGTSRADLQNAFNQSQASIANATQQAAPYAAATYNQNVGNLGTAYGNALTNAQWGLDQSTQLRQQGLNNALASGQQGFNAAQGALSPYAQLGNNALAQLSSHVLGPQGAIPQQQWQQPKLNPPSMNLSVGQLPKQQPFNVNQATSLPSDIKSNAMVANLGATQPGFTGSSGTGGSGLGSTIGGLAGGIGGAALAALTGIPFVGPILAGVGALVGALWNNHNPDKAWASNAINDVGLQVWGPNRDGQGGLIQAVKEGQISAEQGKAVFNALWQGWIQAMKNAGLDAGIIDRSVQSQMEYWKTTPQIIDQAAASAPKNQASGAAGGTGSATASRGGWPQ